MKGEKEDSINNKMQRRAGFFYYNSRDQLHVTLINATKTKKCIYTVAGFIFVLIQLDFFLLFLSLPPSLSPFIIF